MVSQMHKVNVIIALILLIFSVGVIHFSSIPLNYIFILCVIFSVAFFYKTKSLICFLIFIYPLLRLIYGLTTLPNLRGTYFSINISGILNLGIVILGILYLLTRRDRISQCRLLIPILIFFGILASSIFFSSLKIWSFRNLIRYAMPVIFYFIILGSFNEIKETQKLLKFALYGSFFPPFVFGVSQFVTRDASIVSGAFMRIYGTFGHPNIYAMFLVLISLLSIYFIFEKTSKYTWLYFGIFLCSVTSLFFTFTRVGWASFLVAFSILGFLKFRKFYFFIFICGILLLMFLPSFKDAAILRLQPNASFYSRFVRNELGISLFKKKPIFGHGLGNYTLLPTTLGRKDVSQQNSSYGIKLGGAPHNDYIGFLVEAGILGLLAYLYLMYSAFKLSNKIFRSINPSVKYYGAFLISMIAAILIFGITDQGFKYGQFYFWIFLAIGEIYLNKSHNIKTFKKVEAQST